MHDRRDHHPAVVRVCHWTFALALAVLISSGLEVFAAFPSFGDKIPQIDLVVSPSALRLGGWLGGALQWHFTFAWLLTIAMAIYIAYQTITGNGRQVAFVPRDVRGVWPMVRHYFFFGPKPALAEIYNPLQKMAYSAVTILALLGIITGFALYKPVHLSALVDAMGGFRMVRVWHFAAMCGVLAFIPGHLVMVALHGWRNFASMWTGCGRA
ncbi:MAG TPA: cytochrome b/b6 domain-containing protein [Vicinamibacterales bacterium]